LRRSCTRPVAVVAVLYGGGRISWADTQAAVPDFALAILFILAFVKTRPSALE